MRLFEHDSQKQKKTLNKTKKNTVISTAAVPRSERVGRQEECGANVGG